MFEVNDAVYVATEEIEGFGTVVEYDETFDKYVIILDTMPDNPISVREEDLSPVEYEEPLPEVPPFGMTEDQLAAYASALAERVTNQVTGLDTNEELGYQVVEGSDLGAVLVATMQEIEQAMIGCAMAHLRVARVLGAAKAMGIAGGD